jgi:hypothetical protein
MHLDKNGYILLPLNFEFNIMATVSNFIILADLLNCETLYTKQQVLSFIVLHFYRLFYSVIVRMFIRVENPWYWK